MSNAKSVFEFLRNVFLRLVKFFGFNIDEEQQATYVKALEEAKQEPSETQKEERVNLARRTLLNNLYNLEQEISIYELSFPNEHKMFMDRIDALRDKYNTSLEELSSVLTFEVDPELDIKKIGEVAKLEMDINTFIQKEGRFKYLCERLERMAVMLNQLYNVTIEHCKAQDKQKAIDKLYRVQYILKEIVHDFKSCSYILQDNQLKERIVSLISYADYQIFRGYIRNSEEMPDRLIKKSVMVSEFDEFDYMSAFSSFVKDELSDLGELLTLISDSEEAAILKREYEMLFASIIYTDDKQNKILDMVFWIKYLEFETVLLEVLKSSGVEGSIANVRILIRMNISVNSPIVSAKVKANLELKRLYLQTKSDRFRLFLKFMKDISEDVTYKEIYFLSLLFEVMDVIQSNPNGLLEHIQKYADKYPYSKEEIAVKKQQVLSISNKDYVLVFSVNDCERELLNVLDCLNFDYMLEGDKVWINSFYFNALPNVVKSFHTT